MNDADWKWKLEVAQHTEDDLRARLERAEDELARVTRQRDDLMTWSYRAVGILAMASVSIFAFGHWH